MVKAMGCEYVLAGHSERRTLFKDDDASINRKVRNEQLCFVNHNIKSRNIRHETFHSLPPGYKIRKSLKQDLRPILCIGESFDEYQSDLADVVCRIELSKDLKDVTEEVIIRPYDPLFRHSLFRE